MWDDLDADTALPLLLTTQLMAAEVYSRFITMTPDEAERKLWRTLLAEEVDHVVYLRNLMASPLPADLRFPFINADRMNDVCHRVTLQGMSSFILRLEGALRLECAELDYGLEALAAKRLAKHQLIVNYPGDIISHIDDLVYQAKRYRASPNIANQITRLEELYDTSVSGTTAIIRETT